MATTTTEEGLEGVRPTSASGNASTSIEDPRRAKARKLNIDPRSASQGSGMYKPPNRATKFTKSAQDRIDSLKSRIEADKYDVQAWERLISELKSRQKSEDALEILRKVYGDMVEVFPTSSSAWRGYIETEMSAGNTQNVNELFGSSLLKIKSLELWRLYIRHVKNTNQSSTTEGSNAIKQAYEFTLDHLGTDISSGPLWMEYVLFLQQANASILFGKSVPGNEESAKLVAIRRAFQRAVTIPTHSLEALWRDYEAFEDGVNRQLAKQIVNDLQGQYATSRGIYRELKKRWEGIKVNMMATPPSNKAKEYEQQKLWNRLISFEKSNPLKLEAEPLCARVELMYNQCLLCLYHNPEFWYEYATWHAENGRESNASEVFKDACSALPTCTILYFAAADFEASQDKIEDAKAIYESLLSRAEELELHTQGQIWIQYMRFLRRTEGASSSRKLFLRARKSEGCTHHIYSTSALLEWQNGKDMKVAKNIFELGLKSYLKETDYVLEYAHFLTSQGDISNARTLYERALTVVQGAEVKVIWNEYLKFEYQCGDLQSTLALEKRRKEALAELNETESESLDSSSQFTVGLLLLRYNIKNMLPCSENMLRHLQTIGVDESYYELPNLTSTLESEAEKQTAPKPAAKQNGKQSSSGLPPAIDDILSKLPLRYQLSGQMPSEEEVDNLIQVIMSLDFTALKAAQEPPSFGGDRGRKRGASSMQERKLGNASQESMNMPNYPPKYDVYRMRQQQRQRKK